VFLCLLNTTSFELEGDTFLERIVVWDKTWTQYFTSESKWSSMEVTRDLYHPRKFKTSVSLQDVFLGFGRSDLFSSTRRNN
jgi:hypothetical protein